MEISITEAQSIADLTAKFIGIEQRPKIQYVKGDGPAFAYYLNNRIEIPIASFAKHGTIWAHWIIIHEVCHFAKDCGNHGRKFKTLEKKALAFWGIYIAEYRKTKGKTFYPEKLQYFV